ncbi:MAG: hypothetical protein ACI4L5_01310 [Negativibacillus sp.]
MNANELRNWIDSLTDDIEFRYRNIWGSICPFNRENISVSYGDQERTFHSVDEVMDTPFIDGKAIKDICQQFEI